MSTGPKTILPPKEVPCVFCKNKELLEIACRNWKKYSCRNIDCRRAMYICSICFASGKRIKGCLRCGCETKEVKDI
jgi:hypothetical protein